MHARTKIACRQNYDKLWQLRQIIIVDVFLVDSKMGGIERQENKYLIKVYILGWKHCMQKSTQKGVGYEL